MNNTFRQPDGGLKGVTAKRKDELKLPDAKAQFPQLSFADLRVSRRLLLPLQDRDKALPLISLRTLPFGAPHEIHALLAERSPANRRFAR
jgi:hypothetical protein